MRPIASARVSGADHAPPRPSAVPRTSPNQSRERPRPSASARPTLLPRRGCLSSGTWYAASETSLARSSFKRCAVGPATLATPPPQMRPWCTTTRSAPSSTARSSRARLALTPVTTVSISSAPSTCRPLGAQSLKRSASRVVSRKDTTSLRCTVMRRAYTAQLLLELALGVLGDVLARAGEAGDQLLRQVLGLGRATGIAEVGGVRVELGLDGGEARERVAGARLVLELGEQLVGGVVTARERRR